MDKVFGDPDKTNIYHFNNDSGSVSIKQGGHIDIAIVHLKNSEDKVVIDDIFGGYNEIRFGLSNIFFPNGKISQIQIHSPNGHIRDIYAFDKYRQNYTLIDLSSIDFHDQLVIESGGMFQSEGGENIFMFDYYKNFDDIIFDFHGKNKAVICIYNGENDLKIEKVDNERHSISCDKTTIAFPSEHIQNIILTSQNGQNYKTYHMNTHNMEFEESDISANNKDEAVISEKIKFLLCLHNKNERSLPKLNDIVYIEKWYGTISPIDHQKKQGSGIVNQSINHIVSTKKPLQVNQSR